MISSIKQGKRLPRWSIFAIDLVICLFAIFLAYLLRFNFSIPEKHIGYMAYALPLVIALRFISFFIFKTYSGIIQHASTDDAIRIFYTITAGSVIFGIVNIVRFYFTQNYLIPFSVIIIDYLISMFFMMAYRLFVKILYSELRNVDLVLTKVIVYGAGEAGIITKKTLDRDKGTNYKVVAFVDDNPSLAKKKLEGIWIHDAHKELESLLQTQGADQLIISDPDLPLDRKQEVIGLCLKHDVKILNVPPMSKWINGELSFKQIKEVRIEDLLERPPIKLAKKIIRQQLVNKKVLISGAAGSIGSELVRQIIPFKPAKIILLDNAETALYELEHEMQDRYKFRDYEIVMGDVRNKERMENLFRSFEPDFVYHAAAYKHVPMMELNPSEAVLNNVQGTKVMADLSVQYGVVKFVLVSTDKAVNPTSVMGASKRVAEIYVQSLNNKLHVGEGMRGTRFITTRFGNVLGSNGSVIPLFRKQIQSGGPVTVTHPEVTRYFMTIPEACQLVLEAGSMGKGGEIFIFDMGESVKIADLAKKMIKLSGLELGKDIQIVFTGLRPGEKLYEELLNNQENTLPTHHPKIMIAKVAEYEFEEIAKHIIDLIELFKEQDNFRIVSKMKEIIPEYSSKNSVYESLDEQPAADVKKEVETSVDA